MIDLPGDTPIWRYMRLPQFIEMMMSFALFQTRVSEFDDALEGAFGYKDIKIADGVIDFLDPPRPKKITAWSRHSKPDDPVVELGPVSTEDTIRKARLHSAVTCWYRHDGNESYAMWRVYGNDSFAVAITTTLGALRDAFQGLDDVRIGGVEYEALPKDIASVHELFFHKRPEFESEREVRSVCVLPKQLPSAVLPADLSAAQMNALLENLVAAPGMRNTMYESLRRLVVDTFKGKGVAYDPNRFRRSALDNDRLEQGPAGLTIVVNN